MALPTSGSISLLAIRDELAPGDAAALNLNFYRGKTYSIAAGGQRTISASPAFSEFYGLQRVSYRLDALTYHTGYFPGAVASLSVGNDGGFYASQAGSNARTLRYSWVTGAAASLYELRVSNVTLDGFSAGSDGIGVWLPLSTSRAYSRAQHTGAGGIYLDGDVIALYEIREASSGLIVASATIELFAIGNV